MFSFDLKLGEVTLVYTIHGIDAIMTHAVSIVHLQI